MRLCRQGLENYSEHEVEPVFDRNKRVARVNGFSLPLESFIVRLTHRIYPVFQRAPPGLGKQLKSTHVILSVIQWASSFLQIHLTVMQKLIHW